MISVGLIIEKNTNYEYVINMVMAQIHDEMEVICSFDEGLEISAHDILECINMHQREKVRRIHAIRKRSNTYENHIKTLLIEVVVNMYLFTHQKIGCMM